MYNIIPFILILISLGVIVFIIVRKFPVLANIDVENIPEEKEARFKEKIISSRLKRNIFLWSSKITRIIIPAWRGMMNFFKWSYNKLHEFKESYKNVPIAPENKVSEDNIEILLNEAKSLIKKNDFKAAEKKLIKVISLDTKNIEAFKALGSLYFERKSYDEARQTFKHVLKISEEDGGEIYLNLAIINKEIGDIEKAFINIERALAKEPNNPRYLDTMLNISIIKKDKASAIKALEALQNTNPDNQKLAEFKKQIDEL